MLTLYSQEELPCIQVLLTECKRKSHLLLHLPSRSRSSLHQRGSTLYGLEDPSCLLYPPSSLCGYPNRNMMSLAQELFIVNVFKHTRITYCYWLWNSAPEYLLHGASEPSSIISSPHQLNIGHLGFLSDVVHPSMSRSSSSSPTDDCRL
jgi:hypothetical protein